VSGTTDIAEIHHALDAARLILRFPFPAYIAGNRKREETKLETKRRFSFRPLENWKRLGYEFARDVETKPMVLFPSFLVS